MFEGFQFHKRVTGKDMFMKRCHVILSQGLLLLLLATSYDLSAADAPQPKETAKKTVAEPNVSAAWLRRIPEVTSDNLPLGEIIQLLRRDFPELNFLIKQQSETDVDVSSISVKMTLRAVTLEEILKALELAADRPIQITRSPEDRLVIFENKPGPVAVDATGLPIQSHVSTRVFNISRYLESRTDKEIATAMQEVQDVLQTVGRMYAETHQGNWKFNPRLNIHRGTKLLIAVGRPDELAVVEQVVMELQGGPAWEKMSATPERPTKASPPGGSPAGPKP